MSPRSEVGRRPIPDGIVVRRHLELRGRRGEAYVRRGLVAVVAAIPLLALFGVFGQRPSTTTAEGEAGRLVVEAPTRLRGGLLFEARIELVADRELSDVSVVLGPGWIDGMQVNSIKPEPAEERGRDGQLVLAYGRVDAGETLLLRLQFQVDATQVGRRSQAVAIENESVPVLGVSRTVTVFP